MLLLLLSGYGTAAPSNPQPSLYARAKTDDLGIYVDSDDVGIHLYLETGVDRVVTGPVGILQWGAAQFGTTGILGYTPTSTITHIQIYIIQVD